MSAKAVIILRELFQAFMDDPELLPPEASGKARIMDKQNGESGKARAVADYIAGMTDRYAIREHQRIFQPAELT